MKKRQGFAGSKCTERVWLVGRLSQKKKNVTLQSCPVSVFVLLFSVHVLLHSDYHVALVLCGSSSVCVFPYRPMLGLVLRSKGEH